MKVMSLEPTAHLYLFVIATSEKDLPQGSRRSLEVRLQGEGLSNGRELGKLVRVLVFKFVDSVSTISWSKSEDAEGIRNGFQDRSTRHRILKGR